jgi:D-alanyl-D-alanine dipeptidase
MNLLSIQELQEVPIPPLPSIAGRESVSISECGEALVSLDGLRASGIALQPEYCRQDYSAALNDCFVREAVRMKLLAAARHLIPDRYLVILDAWRPVELQRQIFDRIRSTLKSRFLDATDNDLDEKTKVYVSYPSLNADAPPPHLTGGAVDLSIADKDLALLEMGTSFDHFGPEAGTRYFEEKLAAGDLLSRKEQLALKNRRLLFHLLSNQGFTNYREEWWHFDYGDQFWGKSAGTSSPYGPVFQGPSRA